MRVFTFIEEHKSVYTDKSKRSKPQSDATRLGEMTNIAKTKKEYTANKKEIEQLRTELQKLMDKEDDELPQLQILLGAVTAEMNRLQEVTCDIVHSTTVVELHENGGQLFGWPWAKKAAREKQIATETDVIE